ncbi:hypothetical protein P879_01598 [Paragonimus westermani]|uniref:FAD-binding domain-containing protein n=1 Tax=Paragonimus westermani TaxID=34504 RepID=A0A8T0DWA6_9TREM|nr:hypothetical protein P879_01598 [Paragonimus westermani]
MLLHEFGRFLKLSTRFCGSTAKKESFFDIVIVGGGMVGYGFAALAAASSILRGKHILLLESAPQKPYVMPEEYESRTVAIGGASQKMLQDLGAWEFICSKRMQPVNKMKVWEDQSDAFLTFERNPLAHIVENRLVAESLKQAALKQTNPPIMFHNTRVTNIQLPETNCPDQLVHLIIQSPTVPEPWSLRTNLLIGADGANSEVRLAAGLKTISWDHGQSAVVASLCMGENHEEFTAWQRFIPTGPIALLPLSRKHSCLIWSTTNAEADRLMGISEQEFIHELNDALCRPSVQLPTPMLALAKLGEVVSKSLDYVCGLKEPSLEHQPIPPRVEGLQPKTVRSRFPLGFQHANSYHAPRVAIVGDAAHRILPLAGQGVNLGFGDVMCLVKRLEEAISQGADIGSPAFLQAYTTDRQRAVVPVAAVMETLNLLYSTDAYVSKLLCVPGRLGTTEQSPLLRFSARLLAGLRAAGVTTVQSSALLKKFIVESAVTGQLGVPTADL